MVKQRLHQRLFNRESTLLHYVAQRGETSFAKEIIGLCPECAQLVDDKGQNFLHVAAAEGHLELVKQVSTMKEMTSDILNKQNKEGNTPLQVAIHAGKIDVARYLLYDQRVMKTVKNAQGKTALEEITFEYDKNEAFCMSEKELELSIAPEQVELYRRLVTQHGEIVRPNLPEFMVGPAGKGVAFLLNVISEMLVATTESISQEQISKWGEISSYYSYVGLQIEWFPTLISRLRDWFSDREDLLHHIDTELARKEKEIVVQRQKLSQMEAEVVEIKENRVKARTTESGFPELLKEYL